MGKPKCQIPKCENNAMLLFGGIFICGKCYMNYHNRKQAEIKKALIEGMVTG